MTEPPEARTAGRASAELADTPLQRETLVGHIRRRLYADLASPRRRYRREIVSASESADAILDIGCGYEAPDLAAIPNCDADRVGIDMVSDFRPERAPGVVFIVGNSEHLPFRNESFSLVICRSVLEHVVHPQRVFEEISRVLKPGGQFRFLTPNRWDYVSLGASVIPNSMHGRLVKAMTGRDEEDTFPTFYRANSRNTLQRLAKDSGLVVERLEMLREHPHYLQFNPLAYLAGAAFELTVQKLIPASRPWILGTLSKP
ncbi:class I SAM-dependent methyltransferase [Maioricimonas rarisocia]|nr:class I SAM-dependent methyltransferase [Maioricimonas rarisocia]